VQARGLWRWLPRHDAVQRDVGRRLDEPRARVVEECMRRLLPLAASTPSRQASRTWMTAP
jgi:hypothetical protein